MKTLLTLIGLLILISCAKEEVKKERDYANADFEVYNDILNLMEGAWDEVEDNGIYVFRKDLTYDYYKNRFRTDFKSVQPEITGEYSITPAKGSQLASVKLYYLSIRYGPKVIKWDLDSYDTGDLNYYHRNSVFSTKLWSLRRKD